jgi:predicted DCC family thiol-disulfide oxidoreductase YuxK
VKWVVFYDGACGFCTRSVRWVYKLDERECVDFSPLQGELAKDLGLLGYDDQDGGSMVLYREQDGAKFFRGDALIELGKVLGGVWKLTAWVFSLFPRSWRDGAYIWMARNRYRFSRGIRSCELPEEGLRKRMRV